MKEGSRAEHGVREGGKGRTVGGKGGSREVREGGWVVSREAGMDQGKEGGRE